MVTDKRSVWEKAGPGSDAVRELPQVKGTRTSISRDFSRKARLPGLRVAKKSGNLYWETRENRSDKRGTTL